MTRQGKITVANLIMGLMYQHHIYEWRSLQETKSDCIHRWVMFGKDMKYKMVLQEMEKKKIIEFKSDKNGNYAAFNEFLGYQNTGSTYLIPVDERTLINGKTGKGFILDRIEMELARKLKRYKEIMP